jgi:hypothetical protein
MAQVNVPETASVGVGRVALWLITDEVVAVQPLLPVTVTEYVPGALITAVPAVAFCETIPGPLNVYGLPPVAVSVRLVWAQVSVLLGLADSVGVGAVVLLLTVVVAVAVHPLLPVIVTEYVPGALTVRVLPLPANVPDGPAKA